jgi:hypothetical protein
MIKLKRMMLSKSEAGLTKMRQVNIRLDATTLARIHEAAGSDGVSEFLRQTIHAALDNLDKPSPPNREGGHLADSSTATTAREDLLTQKVSDAIEAIRTLAGDSTCASISQKTNTEKMLRAAEQMSLATRQITAMFAMVAKPLGISLDPFLGIYAEHREPLMAIRK